MNPHNCTPRKQSDGLAGWLHSHHACTAWENRASAQFAVRPVAMSSEYLLVLTLYRDTSDEVNKVLKI